MHVEVRHAGDVIIVDFNGDLVTGDGDELLGEGWRKILLNLAKVHRMDSSGVGELVASWKLAEEFGAAVKLLRPGDRLKSTLHLSQILPLLEVYEDEAEAVRHFGAA